MVGQGESRSLHEPTAKVKSRKKPRFKQDFTVVVKVAAEGTTSPHGRVVVRIDGKKVGTRASTTAGWCSGHARTYKAGKHKLVASYKGSDTVEDSKDTADVPGRASLT